ncbi:MAG: autoinducer binding domain-containing protein [Candidatus Sedimenticola sp. (ex Thyasira tokunagai)]
MVYNINSYITSIEGAGTKKELEDIISAIFKEAGFGYYALVLVDELNQYGEHPHLTSFPKGFVEMYKESNFSDLDPVIIQGKGEYRLVRWENFKRTSADFPLFDTAQKAGLIHGCVKVFTFPRGGVVGVCSLARSEGKISDEELKEISPLIEPVADALLKRFYELSEVDRVKIIIPEKRNNVLRLLVEGHRPKQIADKLSIVLDTVNGHIKNLKMQFGVQTTTKLVLKASRLDLH